MCSHSIAQLIVVMANGEQHSDVIDNWDHKNQQATNNHNNVPSQWWQNKMYGDDKQEPNSTGDKDSSQRICGKKMFSCW